ncbi:MAG: hypothetical protein LC789_11185 [Actinobacteria bacterium]|nr:hypothetical protein [Actinomycetota bacterium]
MGTTPADRRNPYLVLGIPYGATAKEANRAFARRSRAAKKGNLRYPVYDLTWALHQIEQAELDPASSLSYFRVPADPTALELDVPLPVPSARPIPRTTDVDVEREVAALKERISRDLCWSLLVEAYAEPVTHRNWMTSTGGT